jgi:23S rRNA (cytidine1920-2'-O)/16S rRNA (cytidine1409-2'-O)-methyltransferase
MAIYKKKRLDRILVDRGLAATRSRAADLVRLGAVTVEGMTAAKPSMLLPPDAALAIAADASPYVSRGGLKLAAALDAFGLDPKGLIALDIGASTGGFTDVLLARGATRIFAVDVGSGQLHARLRQDPRVVALEGIDARRLDTSLVTEAPGAIVADLSFISLTKGLQRALQLAAPSAWLVALVKPQFEAGPEAVSRGGIVRDPAARARSVAEVRAFMDAQPGWRVFAEMPSPIAVGSGNEEFLIGARHGT